MKADRIGGPLFEFKEEGGTHRWVSGLESHARVTPGGSIPPLSVCERRELWVGRVTGDPSRL